MGKVRKRCLQNSNGGADVIEISNEEAFTRKTKLLHFFNPKSIQVKKAKVEEEQAENCQHESIAMKTTKASPMKAMTFKFASLDVDFAPYSSYGSLSYNTMSTEEPTWEINFRKEPIIHTSSSSKWSDLSFDEQPLNEPDQKIEVLKAKRKKQKQSQSLEPLPWSQQLDLLDCPLWQDDSHLVQARKILLQWRKRLDKEQNEPVVASKSKKKQKRLKQSSDDEDCESDEEYNPDGEYNSIENPVLFYGPSTSKELSIYRLAEQCRFKILELHTGDKRDGDSLRKRIEAAATSHRVNLTEKSLNNFFAQRTNSGADEKKTKGDREHTLILVSNIDISFQVDYNFITSLTAVLENVHVPVFVTCKDEIKSGPLIDLPNLLQIQIPTVDDSPEILEKLAANSNFKLSQADFSKLSTFFNNDLHKSANWLQFSCATHGKVSLPIDLRNKFDDPFRTHLKGVDQELVPSWIHKDHHEEKFEKRSRYPQIFETLKPTTGEETKWRMISKFVESLDYMEGRKDLCTDVLPMLQVMNVSYRSQITGRRSLHYFSQTQGNSSVIDRNGQLLPLLAQFHNNTSNILPSNFTKH
ncbi:unnamed protein product, partial [Mesorhabditis belari]|uniref:Origin recognition complex subunit 2 n=1 Tax=Mesorhabditis belari TaxID=2138241 RepID=A0AAF3F100_9BILA